eukprot:TRINITY_DN11301_c0_g1_i2.p1 TRINITY_DN11301_c0_g1~~TRINITY_DN11301_c0_g1_i2.p1  ORF type:complete len:1221 (-),score=297.78 TRINITY_DN11301_c0_g1_i2:66-3446(-)
MKDFVEIRRNALPTLNARPMKDNIFEWHANMVAASDTLWGGLIFHLIMEFPYDYPFSPPKVIMCNQIDHPNIFGKYICLDMLEQGGWSTDEQKQKRNVGWTTCYSVQSILVQLQSFLSTHGYKDQEVRDYGLQRSFTSINEYKCKCNHHVKLSGVEVSRRNKMYTLPPYHVDKNGAFPPIDSKVLKQIYEETKKYACAIQIAPKSAFSNWRVYWAYIQKKDLKEQQDLNKWERAFERRKLKMKGPATTNETKFERFTELRNGVLSRYIIPGPRKVAKKTDEAEEEPEKDAEEEEEEEEEEFRLPGSRVSTKQVLKADMKINFVKGRINKSFRSVERYETTNGVMYYVKIDEKNNGRRKTTLQEWEEVYPEQSLSVNTDPIVAARRASGIPVGALAESAPQPLNLPNQKEQVKFYLNIPSIGLKTNITAVYNIEHENVSGMKWKLVTPDPSRLDNYFVLSLSTNSFNLTYLLSIQYYVFTAESEESAKESTESEKTEDTQKTTAKKDDTPKGGAAQKGDAQKGAPQKGGAKKGGAQKGSAKKGGAQKGGAQKGGAQKGGAQKGGAQKGGAQKGGAQKGGAQKGGAQKGGQKKGGQKGAQKGGQKDGGKKGGATEEKESKAPVYVVPISQPIAISGNFDKKRKNRRRRRNRKDPAPEEVQGKGKEKIDEPAPVTETIAAPVKTVEKTEVKPAPEKAVVPKPAVNRQAAKRRRLNAKKFDWQRLPPELKLYIFSFFDRSELISAAKLCEEFENLALDSSYWARSELLCYHTRMNFYEDVLGIGINIHYYPNSKNIEYVETPLDLISNTAFNTLNLRRGAWKEPIQHWMPLYLSAKHWQAARPLCEAAITEMIGDIAFDPMNAVKLLTKLMNTMIVTLMKGETWASEKALEGYFAFHHLLLVFIEEYPELQKWVDETLGNFIASEDKRIKKVVPALGEFIPLLAVTDKYSWKDIRQPLIKEVFDRNQKWALRAYPALGNKKSGGDQVVDLYRIKKTHEATKVSQRLVMFHVYFLKTIAKPRGSSVEVVRRMYDHCYGRPTMRMKFSLQRATKTIQKVDNWIQFFNRIDMPLPNPRLLTRWLRDSVRNSERKRYHYWKDYEGAVRNKNNNKKSNADPNDDGFDDVADNLGF